MKTRRRILGTLAVCAVLAAVKLAFFPARSLPLDLRAQEITRVLYYPRFDDYSKDAARLLYDGGFDPAAAVERTSRSDIEACVDLLNGFRCREVELTDGSRFSPLDRALVLFPAEGNPLILEISPDDTAVYLGGRDAPFQGYRWYVADGPVFAALQNIFNFSKNDVR